MRNSRKQAALAWVGLVLVASLGWAGCTDEEAVFGERPFFDDPSADASGFLGYDNRDLQLTVCGNCHVGQQSEWEETGHPHAWEEMEESGLAPVTP